MLILIPERYLNDTQEIDMEFLSSQMNETAFPVNLVLHSTLSFQNGGDASSTPSYKVVNLPFQPSNGIHEYRFGEKRLHLINQFSVNNV